VTMHIRSELLDVVIVNGRARGIVTRDLVTATSTVMPPTCRAGHGRVLKCLLPLD